MRLILMTRLILMILGVFLLVSAFDTTAHAQRRRHRARVEARKIDTVRFDAHMNFGWHSALGSGFRVDIPIIKDGFIKGVEDELALSPGMDFFYWSFDEYCHGNPNNRHCHGHGEPGFWPLTVAQWNFYITDKWSFFPEAGIVTIINDEHFDHAVSHHHILVRPVFAGGARFHFGTRLALLLRAGYPFGFQAGLNF